MEVKEWSTYPPMGTLVRRCVGVLLSKGVTFRYRVNFSGG
nr:MAG TPA: hypothetical protein [Caudoviricetes sp.]